MVESNRLEDVYKNLHDFWIEDEVVLKVLREYESRSKEGMKTYGISMQDNAADITFWIKSAQEEAMDLTLYLQKLLDVVQELRNGKAD